MTDEINSGAVDNTLFENRLDISMINDKINKIREETARVIVGQQEMTDLIIAAILSDGHVLLEGVPGTAKTLMAKLIARTIDAGFSRIQFTPDLMPSDVLGTSVFNPANSDFELRKGPVFSNIVLADEINRSPAKTQSALFEVMEERQVTIDGTAHKMDFPFLVLATQNPIEQEGTYRLPEAQIDRFLFKINVAYPTLDEEVRILQLKHTLENHLDLSRINIVITRDELSQIRQIVHKIHIDDNILNYIAKIVQDSRSHASLYLGASPRASVAILQSSKAVSAMNGRDFVTPEDVQFTAYPVLRHRFILAPEKEMEGVSPDDIIKDIIQKIEVPR